MEEIITTSIARLIYFSRIDHFDIFHPNVGVNWFVELFREFFLKVRRGGKTREYKNDFRSSEGFSKKRSDALIIFYISRISHRAQSI